MYKCLIFDLDGTLVNSIYAIQRSASLTMEHFGLRPISEEEAKRFIGDGAKKLVERSLAACGDPNLTHYEEAVAVYQEIFKRECLYRVEAYAGIPELLAFLKREGIKAAVFSNKPHARTLDNVYGVFGEDVFDLVCGEREAEGIRRKPAPDGVWAILKAFGIARGECLYLGDTNTDMRTGAAAGVDTVGVTWGFRPRCELEAFSPKYLVDTPAQVIDLIKEANGLG